MRVRMGTVAVGAALAMVLAVLASGCAAPGSSPGDPGGAVGAPGATPIATAAPSRLPPRATPPRATPTAAPPTAAVPKAAVPGVSVIPLPTAGLGLLPPLPASRARGLASVAWSLIGFDDNGRRVSLSVEVGGCLHVRGARVTSAPDAVTIAVLADPVPDGVLCTAEGRTLLAAVRLPDPIGTRQVRHAPTP